MWEAAARSTTACVSLDSNAVVMSAWPASKANTRTRPPTPLAQIVKLAHTLTKHKPCSVTYALSTHTNLCQDRQYVKTVLPTAQAVTVVLWRRTASVCKATRAWTGSVLSVSLATTRTQSATTLVPRAPRVTRQPPPGQLPCQTVYPVRVIHTLTPRRLAPYASGVRSTPTLDGHPTLSMGSTLANATQASPALRPPVAQLVSLASTSPRPARACV